VHHQAVEKRTIVQTISDLAAHLRSGKVTCASGALADASTSGCSRCDRRTISWDTVTSRAFAALNRRN